MLAGIGIGAAALGVAAVLVSNVFDRVPICAGDIG